MTITQRLCAKALRGGNSIEHFQHNETLAVQIDDAIREAVEPLFRGNTQKMHKIWLAICDKLVSNGYTDDEAEAEADILMEFTQRQEEYD